MTKTTQELTMKIEESDHLIELLTRASVTIERYSELIKIQMERIDELEEEVESLNLRLMEAQEQ